MRLVFADTSFFLALFNKKDSLNSMAQALSRNRNLHYVTTYWVLAEVGDAFCKPPHRGGMERFLDIIL